MTVYLGENIKNFRHQKGITQETLAEFLGVTFQSVSRWERGESYPDITMLPEIADFFKVTVDDLLGSNKKQSEKKVQAYLELYDTMKLKNLAKVFNEYKNAVKEFPRDFRLLVRYMQLLHEAKLRTLSISEILSGEYKKPSEEISKIYDIIQKYCTDDSIRIWSKTIMISHLLWKYDCVCNEEGKYGVYEEYLRQAKDIIETLPAMCDSREIMAIDGETQKNTLEELIFHLHNELFGFCLSYPVEKRIIQYESLENLLSLVYPDGVYGKNCYNRLYNLGHLGFLYQQSGNNEKALKYLKEAAEYAKELDKTAELSERAKRFYNYGKIYRETTASEFMKIVMSEHYPLTADFKLTEEFKKIIAFLEG